MSVESLDSVLAKRDSFAHMWELLHPQEKFRDLYYPCMRVWNKLSHRAQQRMYWYIREKKRRGEMVYENPLYALVYITPQPRNCNGRADLDEILKHNRMVSAYYNGKFGIYTLCEATIFEMTNVKPIN
jgi:hypothetical protein